MKRGGLVLVLGVALLAGLLIAVAGGLNSRQPKPRVSAPGPGVSESSRDAKRPEADAPGTADAERYRAHAFPKREVALARTLGARRAAARVPRRLTPSDFKRGALARDGRSTAAALALPHPWAPLGPAGGAVFTDIQGISSSPTSGRITALAISPSCKAGDCRLWVAAAGGGIWRTDDALATRPAWSAVDRGLGSQAVGSLALDPNDHSANTIYAGTGEGNLGDSQAGFGLYKSVDGGDTWTLVPGSAAVATGADIGAIAIDPTNPAVIWIGTGYALHGRGPGQYPPGAPAPRIHKSIDAGAHFTLEATAPHSPIVGLQVDPVQHDTVYAATFDQGVWRSAPSVENGDASWYRILDVNGRNTVGVASHSRVWATGDEGEVYRIDNADLGHTAVTATKVSNAANGASGFCEQQCYYDQALAVDPAHPDTAWIGGAFDASAFDKPATGTRSVLRTLDGGSQWTDMSASVDDPYHHVHPDQHAIVLDPGNPNIAFEGSDGGLVRTSGSYADGAAKKPCGNDQRCRQLLSSVPTKILSLNAGLDTLQFESLSVPNDTSGDVQGGTQDNGTWERSGASGRWLETFGGDGGDSAFDATDPSLRLATYVNADPLMSAERGAPRSWKDISHGLKGQRSYFYAPFIADPVTHGTLFGGLADVWRTRDDGATDWERLVPASPYGELVSAVARAPSDTSTLWVGRGDGTLEVSTNADAAIAQDVRFTTISSGQTPFRYVSSIVVDPADATHAWVAYSGYEAYTPSTPGHVFSVRFNPADGTAAFTDVSNGIGDQPVNAVAYDPGEHDLYAATDFGVMRLPSGATTWAQAAPGLPANVAIYGLTFSAQRRVLYAATHGRSAYSIDLVGAVPAARPQTTLTSGPSGELASRTVSFSFAANPPDGASFTCKLDGRARPCSSPTTYRHVRNGPHTFSVAAKNINGADLTPAGRSFSVRVDHIRLRLRPARTTLGAVLRRGLLVKAFCAPSCSVRMKLRLHGRRSAVASGRAPAGGRWFRLHLSRKERRALRHARRATFVLRARAIAPGTTAGHERTDVIVFR